MAVDDEMAKKLRRAAAMQARWRAERDALIRQAHADGGGGVRISIRPKAVRAGRGRAEPRGSANVPDGPRRIGGRFGYPDSRPLL